MFILIVDENLHGHTTNTYVCECAQCLKSLHFLLLQKRNQQLISSSLASSATSSSPSLQTNNRPQVQNNLRPTTYRPPRLLASGLEPTHRLNSFEAPLNVNDAQLQLTYPVAPSDIHRRADNFQQPVLQQLLVASQAKSYDKPIIQPSMEIYVNHEAPIYYNQPQLRNLYRTHQIHPQQYNIRRDDLERRQYDLDLGQTYLNNNYNQGRSFPINGNGNAAHYNYNF